MNRRRRSEKEQKKLADDARLLRWWAAWHREQRDEALAKYPCLAELFRAFQNLEHAQPVQVLGLAAAFDWTEIDYATKLTVLHEVNNSITNYRVKRGHVENPIADPLPGEPESAFRQLKAILFPPEWGAHRGVARPE